MTVARVVAGLSAGLLALFTLAIAGASGAARTVSGTDLRTFYTAGLMVRAGEGARLHDLEAELAWERRTWPGVKLEDQLPFFNPHWFALLWAPLSLLSPVAAYAVSTCALGALIAWLLALLLAEVPDGPRRRLAWALLCTSPCLVLTLKLGQPAPLLGLALTAAWRDLREGRDARAGVWLALLSIKPHLLLAPVVALVALRRWRALPGLAGGLATLGAVSLAVGGVEGLQRHAALLSSQVEHPHPVLRPELGQGLRGFLCAVTGLEQAALRPVWLVLAAALHAVSLAAIWRGGSREGEPWRLDAAWALAIVTGCVAAPHLYFHDTTLLLPAAVLALRLPRGDGAPFVGLALAGSAAMWATALAWGWQGRPWPFVVPVALVAHALLARRLFAAPTPGATG